MRCDPRHAFTAGRKDYVEFMRGQEMKSTDVVEMRLHFAVVGKVYKEALCRIAGPMRERST
jgi:hypothetical protein